MFKGQGSAYSSKLDSPTSPRSPQIKRASSNLNIAFGAQKEAQPTSPVTKKANRNLTLGINLTFGQKKSNEYETNEAVKNSPPPQGRWYLIVVSLGDCKVFLRNRNTGRLCEVSTDGRSERLTDRSDCGGRIGPFLQNCSPDLRNLSISSVFCNTGDIVVCTSDGVHDNLGCSSLGVLPSELKVPASLKEDTWNEVEELIKNDHHLGEEVENLRQKWTNDLFNQIITKNGALSHKSLTLTPSYITNHILPHCLKTTVSSRNWMETQKGKLPKDYKRFPGKMDHCTILSFLVAHKQTTRYSVFGNDLHHIMQEQLENPQNDKDIPEVLKCTFSTINLNSTLFILFYEIFFSEIFFIKSFF